MKNFNPIKSRPCRTAAVAVLAVASLAASFTAGRASRPAIDLEKERRNAYYDGYSVGYSGGYKDATDENFLIKQRIARERTAGGEPGAWLVDLDETDYIVWTSDVTAYFVQTDGSALYWDSENSTGGNRWVSPDDLSQELPAYMDATW